MPPARAFRFGVYDVQTTSVAEYLECARNAEALGYSVLLCADHFERRMFEPGPAMTAAALATSVLRVGCMVFDNDFRHPAVLAKEAATVDVLSGGRLEFGIGAGWHKQEYDQAGIPFEPPSVRAHRMREAVKVIKGLWSDGPLTCSGRYYTISGMSGLPKPAQRPHPPIFIGAGGKQLLTFAAQEANIIGLHLRALPGGGLDVMSATRSALEERVAWVRAAAGARHEELELSMLMVNVALTDNSRAAAERIGSLYGLSAEAVLESPYALIGSVDGIVDKLVEQREHLGISYITVYEKDMQAMAPIVARLAGK